MWERHYTRADLDIQLASNVYGGPESDPELCCNRLRSHICHREPDHNGPHCCGEPHEATGADCMYLWENMEEFRRMQKPLIEEREI
jgi:hypothetical protein